MEAGTDPKRVPRDFDSHNPLHLAALCGADVIGVDVGSLARTLAQHEKLCQFRDAWKSRHGADPVVRLKQQLVFEARDRKGINPRELAVLAAIYSVIGNKRRPVLITRQTIRQRALGYKTRAIFERELPRRTDGASPLTEWQLRSVLDSLAARKFFRRATHGRRQTYYSNRMTDKQFLEALVEMKTYRYAFRMCQRLEDEDLTNHIRNRRAAMAGKPPPVPNARPLVLPSNIPPDDIPFG